MVHEMSEAGGGHSGPVGRQSAETKLLDALETVTVRSVVGLRFRHVEMASIFLGVSVAVQKNADSSR